MTLPASPNPAIFKLGLTGSIAMGKSTTAAMFRNAGVPVHDADAAVHALYGPGGAAVAPIEAIAPGAARNGAIDRSVLRERLAEDPTLLAQLEAVVHPLVSAHRDAFLRDVGETAADLVVFDIPLLFETGAEALVDAVVVVTASAETQRRRALARPGMTEDHLARILSKQLPDAEKRRRADFIIDTDHGLEAARQAVDTVIATIREKTGAPIER